VPLVRTLWLAKKANRSVAMQLVPNKKAKRVDFQIIVKERDGWVDQANPKTRIDNPTFDGAVKRGSATCPCCGYTTPVARVREQLKARHGGANDARLMCVVSTRVNEQGRFYRLPTETDVKAIRAATAELEQRKKDHSGPLSLVPDEKLDMRGIRHTWAMIYGLSTWEDFFTRRQALALTNIARLLNKAGEKVKAKDGGEFAAALQTCLAMVLGRQADALSASVTWTPGGEFQGHTFARQALAFVWDFAEVNPWCDSSGNFMGAVEWVAKVCASGFDQHTTGSTQQASATHHPLPDDSAHGFITDPPYYDAVPYSYLSDFFYVWLRRAVGSVHTELLRGTSVPKDEEVVVDRPHELSNSTHDIAFYERELAKAFSEGRRLLRPDGIGTIVFASKTTASWEAILKAVVDAGWIITGSWPIDTEREARVSAQGQARLASSVHLVCRPRENPDGSMRTDEIGDWRDLLQELPRRIHDWMPRLAEEGVGGADAIFACLGPALEIFSRFSRVEKASGEAVTLKEYLECVWAAVAKEALTIIFPDADTIGFEEDARLTAMWLWTLNAGNTNAINGESAEDEDAENESEGGAMKAKTTGSTLEYDAVRKIAQGLGAHLEDLGSLVEISGETARLLPVGERARHLFGKDEGKVTPERRKREPQMDLFKVLQQADEGGTTFGETKVERHGATVLDRIHQSMILFAAGRGEALKRFLVEDGAGRDQRFWTLAQALSALYPSQTEEKRWVDGVLARKKGLGF
jgi:adenine-specific DNA methylase